MNSKGKKYPNISTIFKRPFKINVSSFCNFDLKQVYAWFLQIG